MSDIFVGYGLGPSTTVGHVTQTPHITGNTLAVNSSNYSTVAWNASSPAKDLTVADLGEELEKVNMRIDQLDQKLELILELLETRKA
jgi:hypothetical protein